MSVTNDSTKWWILGFISFLMFGNYYVYDAIAPVAELLESDLGFSDTQIGTLNAIYSLPNIFLVLIGGLIVDRFGAARVAFWTTLICFVGAVLTAWRGDFYTMAAGRLVFGIGSETMLVAATVAIGIWFSHSKVAFAMALSLAIARAGSYAADLSPVWAPGVFEQGWQPPLMLAAGFGLFSLICATAFWWLDRHSTAPDLPTVEAPVTERLRIKDIVSFGRSYWYILVLCVLFYSVIFPFRSTFAIKYFQHAHDLSLQAAATINSYVFLAAIFATPLFGWIADKYGRRALAMVFGALLLPLSFVGVVMGEGGLWLTTVFLGISFSLIPAVMWPAVIKLVEASRLGTAYGLMFMLQAVGMTFANLIAGWLNDINGAGADNPDGYSAMLVFFAVMASGAFFFAVALWRRETGPNSHGLELPGDAMPAPVRERV